MESPVKSHINLIVVAGVVVVGLAVFVFTAYPLESAQTRLDRHIDEQVDIAQRIMLAYRPVTTHLTRLMGPAATQPVELAPDQWQSTVNKARQEGPGSEQMRQLGSQIQAVNDRAGRLEGEPVNPPQVPPSAQAYRQLQNDLKSNDQMLDEALRIVQEAINLNEGEFTGSDHPAATRLEAVLCYHRADQFRREAALYHSDAEEAQARFVRDVTLWDRIAADIASTERELAGTPAAGATSAPAATTGPAAAAKAAPASEPSVASASAPTASEPALAESKSAGTEAPSEQAAAEPATTTQSALPPIDERIARLEARKAEVTAAIEAAQAQARQLTEAIDKLEQRIAATSQQAADAEQQMLKLQQAGVDPADPQGLKKFTEAYEKASAANRAAYREMTILKQGAVRNARVDTSDEDEVLTKPLVASQPGGQMSTERGLVALRSDLKATEALIEGKLDGQDEGLKVLAKEIGRQIAELTTRKKELTDRVSALRTVHAEVAKQIARSARTAIAATIEALRLEKQGLDMAQTRGLQAAKRAKKAIEKRIEDARARGTAENSPQAMLAGDKIGPGHAIAMTGDLELVAAQILAQQTGALELHAQLLSELHKLGMTIDANLLPAGVTPESAPPAAVRPDAAQTAADKTRTAALEAGKGALEAYNQADAPLQQLWVLHANMATVHHLMANLSAGKEAIEHASAARIEYLRAIKGRDERPETPTLQQAIASLTTRPAK